MIRINAKSVKTDKKAIGRLVNQVSNAVNVRTEKGVSLDDLVRCCNSFHQVFSYLEKRVWTKKMCPIFQKSGRSHCVTF